MDVSVELIGTLAGELIRARVEVGGGRSLAALECADAADLVRIRVRVRVRVGVGVEVEVRVEVTVEVTVRVRD